jgi:phosphatidylserine/phosphatidylglycerophosphate/cardiolipin synthase-like enzyme
VIQEALKRALARKVIVRMIVPECDLNPNPYYNFPALYDLTKLGAEGRLAPSPSTAETPYMHAKSIVVDHRLAFVGSQNFSFTSLTKARETGLVFANQKAIRGLETFFDQDWKHSKALPATTPTTCPKMY